MEHTQGGGTELFVMLEPSSYKPQIHISHIKHKNEYLQREMLNVPHCFLCLPSRGLLVGFIGEALRTPPTR